jgi:hypothetical protein
MAWLGIVVGLVLGIAGIVISEFADDRIYNDAGILELVPAKLLIELPPVRTGGDEYSRAGKRWLAGSVAMAVLLVIGAGTAFAYFRP